jgi:NTP pyrophosphatase (non-canonical NTP hydrolase)
MIMLRASAAQAGKGVVEFNGREAAGRYRSRMPDSFILLRDRLRAFADARDWPRFHTPRNPALALAGEVGELVTELQWVADSEVADHLADPDAKARLADEAADVLIYLTRFADACGIDLLSEAHAKIGRNEIRFPPLS